MKKYKILKSHNRHDLDEEVELYMETGWKPQGGVAVDNFMYTSSGSPELVSSYAQAMTFQREE